jgi:hypothetical protein
VAPVEIYTMTERLSALPAVRTQVSGVRFCSASAVAREIVAGPVAVRVRPIADAPQSPDAVHAAAATAQVRLLVPVVAGSYGINGSTDQPAVMSKQLKGAPRGVPPRGRPV